MRPVFRGPMLSFALVAVAAASDSAAIWLDVPFVRQEKNGCGAASVVMLMRYWSREGPDAHSIFEALYVKDAHGIRGSAIGQYLHAHGFRTFVFAGEWQDLAHHLAKGRPLMVCLKEGRSLHYVVVVGLDPARNLLLINDPARRKLLKVERASFEKDWSAAEHWTLLALPQPGT
jgi:predicted double-glycine peptidase